MSPQVTISTLALVLAVVSLSWQVVRARNDRPIVEVAGQSIAEHAPYGGVRWTFVVRVTNVGDRAVTLEGVAWEIANAPGSRQLYRPDAHEEYQGPEFPVRLEPYDVAFWVIDGYSYVVDGEDCDVTRPLVEVIQRPSIIDRWIGMGPRREIAGPTFELAAGEPRESRLPLFPGGEVRITRERRRAAVDSLASIMDHQADRGVLLRLALQRAAARMIPFRHRDHG